MKLDSLNWNILKCLQENSRQSNTDIARTVGISSPAVAERIRKMEDAGVINGLRILISILPSIFLGIGMLGMFFYPLHGKRLAEVRKGLEKFHLEKKTKTDSNFSK